MAVLNLGAVLGLGLPVLLLHLFSVTLTRALRTYSRSGLEAVCAQRGRPNRADAIAHDDERTERAAEALAVLTGLLLAAFLGASSNRRALGPAVGTVVTIALSLGGIGYVLAGLLGRVHAETILDALWPILGTLRMVMTPLTFLSRSLEETAYRRAGRSIHGSSPRPPSVEVEIHSAGETSAELEADLPDSTRSMLERVVELGRMSVSDLMMPGSSIASLHADVSALEAARAFRETGFSRIPLFGAHRDDIVGVLYAKDLFPSLIDAKDSGSVQPKKLARPPFFVPETKDAADLLIEFRARRVQLAIALDEYGGVAGLISLEDLLEQVVGPIDDNTIGPRPPSRSFLWETHALKSTRWSNLKMSTNDSAFTCPPTAISRPSAASPSTRSAGFPNPATRSGTTARNLSSSKSPSIRSDASASNSILNPSRAK